MQGVIFTHTLKRNWRAALYWGVGIGMIAWYVLVMIPNVDMIEQYQRLMESMPPLLLAAFGMSDISLLSTPEGFVAFAYFSYVLVITSVYAVVVGMNVTAVEEDKGILDVLMSAPISRAQLVIEKCLAYTVLIVAVILISHLGFPLAAPFSMAVDQGTLLVGSLTMIPPTLAVFGFTVLMGALLRNRSTALAVTAAFVVISYFIDFIGNAAKDSVASVLRSLSYFSYYGGTTYINTGIVWGNVAVLLVAGVLLFFGGLVLFQRRDIGL